MKRELEECKVAEGGSLRDALASLERSRAQIALIVDAEDRLVGTVTDGDVRRALLGGVTLDSPLSPHVERHCTTVGPEVRRAEVLDLMRARDVREIPIVDGTRRVLGVHLMREILGQHERPNWAVIMAGGRGSRLLPLTEQVPKPMLPVAGRPILERIVLHLAGYGIRRLFMAIHYLGDRIEQHFGDGTDFGCRIEYLREREPRGSGGALSLLPERPEAPLLVMNGDLVTQVDVQAFLEHHERGGAVASMGVREYQHTIPFGCVDVADGRVERLEEKPTLVRCINAGIYLIAPSLLSRVPSRGEFTMPALIEGCLERGEPVGAFAIQEDWIDVGGMDQLRRARQGSPV